MQPFIVRKIQLKKAIAVDANILAVFSDVVYSDHLFRPYNHGRQRPGKRHLASDAGQAPTILSLPLEVPQLQEQ